MCSLWVTAIVSVFGINLCELLKVSNGSCDQSLWIQNITYKQNQNKGPRADVFVQWLTITDWAACESKRCVCLCVCVCVCVCVCSSGHIPELWCLGGGSSCHECVWGPDRSEQTSPQSEDTHLHTPNDSLFTEVRERACVCVCVCTCSSVKGTPLCWLIFFIRSPPSQNSITINKLPLSAHTQETHTHTHTHTHWCRRTAAHDHRCVCMCCTYLEMTWWRRRCWGVSSLTAASLLSWTLPFPSLTSEQWTHHEHTFNTHTNNPTLKLSLNV